jgi:hypothetical protein
VFQVTVLSIVLTLAVGQNIALLCRTWCDAHSAAASECHYENSSTGPSLAGDESCDKGVVDTIAVLKEDVRRDVSSQDANQAIPVPRYQLAQLKVDARPDQEAWRERSLERRPLSTALRI